MDVRIRCSLFQSQGSSEKVSENVCETEELNFQFDDYGGKKYNFSEPPTG
jgi:hypothetical protein